MFFLDLSRKVRLNLLKGECMPKDQLCKVKSVVLDKSGEGTVNVAMVILISLVLGGLLLGGLYTLIKGNLMPNITQKLNDIIGHKG